MHYDKEELLEQQKEVFAHFRQEIVDVFMDEQKGLEYFESLEIPRDKVYEAIAPNSFSLLVKGDYKDKERVAVFKRLFTKVNGKSSVIRDLLELIVPDSIKMLKEEIDILRENKSWKEIGEIVGIDYRRFHNYYLGYFYPNIKNLKKMSAIISIKTIQAIAKEIHFEEITIDAIKNPNQDRSDLLIRAHKLDEESRVYLAKGLLKGMTPRSLMEISKLAIEESLANNCLD